MALLYPWATKEYLLWEMSLGQIVLYHNLGIELKYGGAEKGKRTASSMSYQELKALRTEARRQLGQDGSPSSGSSGGSIGRSGIGFLSLCLTSTNDTR